MSLESMEFQVFVKPVGASCNLSCKYCYYLDKVKLHKGTELKSMPDEILEAYIFQHLNATSANDVFFSWHGGEPTLAGLEFYRNVVALQKELNGCGKNIINGLQTNGINLTDEWCSFLADERFIVGISLDGPERIHNVNRQFTSGKGSFQDVILGLELVKKHQIFFEILCVVNAHNVDYPLEVYSFFKSIDARYISFLPLVEKHSFTESDVSADSVPSAAFGDFLISIFDSWQEHDIGRIKIQIIEEALRTAFNQDHTLCIFKKNCGGVPVLEKNGDLYSCDHYVKSDYLLGNILQKDLAEMIKSDVQKKFGKQKSDSLPLFCLNCEVLDMCNGECPKNRFCHSPTGEDGLNYLCEGYKKFFMHCKPFAEAVSEVWRSKI